MEIMPFQSGVQKRTARKLIRTRTPEHNGKPSI